MPNWKLYAAAGAAGTIVIAIGLVVWFSVAGWWPIVVDVVLAFTALASLVLLMALVVAVFFFARTVRQIKSELTPVLESLKATSSTMRATASAATTFGVSPAVRTASMVVGAGEIAAVLLRRGQARKRSEKRQRRRQEIERELATKGDLDGAGER